MNKNCFLTRAYAIGDIIHLVVFSNLLVIVIIVEFPSSFLFCLVSAFILTLFLAGMEVLTHTWIRMALVPIREND